MTKKEQVETKKKIKTVPEIPVTNGTLNIKSCTTSLWCL